MITTAILLSFPVLAPAPQQPATLLSAVPSDAWLLVHCPDVRTLRERAERNDWVRLLGSPDGAPILSAFAGELRNTAHTELDDLLDVFERLGGEALVFDTGAVAGLVTETTHDPEALCNALQAWIPGQEGVAALPPVALDGAEMRLVAWPGDLDGWTGRDGHFAAIVRAEQMVGLYSGESRDQVVAAVREGLSNLGRARVVPLVDTYRAESDGRAHNIELFADFTPFVDAAEEQCRQMLDGFLPDPTDLLGLEKGIWLHGYADVFPGSRVDCQARLRIPKDTLAAELADTFKPLPATLPVDLPHGVWALWSQNWDLGQFYSTVRSAYEKAQRAKGLETLDAGLGAARGAAGVDPIDDVIRQLLGGIALYAVEPDPSVTDTDDALVGSIGFHAGIKDIEVFQSAFENVLGVGGLESEFDFEEISGADAYLFPSSDSIDGGLAFTANAFTIAPGRRVLERAIGALTRTPEASLATGSRMRAAVEANASACWLVLAQLTQLRAFALPDMDPGMRLAPLEEGGDPIDPFDALLVMSAERTAEGFRFVAGTR